MTRSSAEFLGPDQGARVYDGVIEDGQVSYLDLADAELGSANLPEPTSPESPTSLSLEERLLRARAIGGISTSKAARQHLETASKEFYRGKLRAIEACLAPLYRDYPYLAPDFLHTIQHGDDLYRHHTGFIDPALDHSEPEGRLWQMVHADPLARSTHQQRAEIAALTAAASVRKHRGVNSHTQFQGLLKTKLVDREAALYVTHNLELFRHYGVHSLDETELAVYTGPDGKPLNKATFAHHDQLADALPGNESAKKFVDLQGPPLVITQLATDVRNHNADSVMPNGFFTKHPRLSGRPQQFMNQTDIIAKVVVAHDGYLIERYHLDKSPKAQVLSALAEIDLAERQGFLDARPDVQYRTAYRVHNVFKKVKRDQLPADAQTIFDRCQAINTIPRY